MKRLVVIAPHADDAELGCGGYISKTIHGGGEVFVAVVATGDIYFSHLEAIVPASTRIEEFENSMKLLGVADSRVFFDQKDTLLDTLPIVAIISEIEAYIKKAGATEVLIPLPSSHQDHVIVYNACLAATRPSKKSLVQLVAAYEYPATAWGAGSSADAGKGGMYVDIRDEIGDKLAALRCYKSQMRNGHCWSEEAAVVMAKLRGLESGLEYAELFHILRRIVV